MPALHIHVHLRGNAGFPERRIVDERVLYRIDRIIFGLFSIYAVYQLYAAAWGFMLWRLNRSAR